MRQSHLATKQIWLLWPRLRKAGVRGFYFVFAAPVYSQLWMWMIRKPSD